MCLYHAISVQTDSVKVESVVYSGQRITKLGIVVTHTLLLILTYVLSFNYMWSGLITYESFKDFYHKNGPV